jgi:hypothetical protein
MIFSQFICTASFNPETGSSSGAFAIHTVYNIERRSKVSQLAGSMVSVYLQMRQLFSVDDHNHYIFTTRFAPFNTPLCTILLKKLF